MVCCTPIYVYSPVVFQSSSSSSRSNFETNLGTTGFFFCRFFYWRTPTTDVRWIIHIDICVTTSHAHDCSWRRRRRLLTCFIKTSWPFWCFEFGVVLNWNLLDLWITATYCYSVGGCGAGNNDNTTNDTVFRKYHENRSFVIVVVYFCVTLGGDFFSRTRRLWTLADRHKQSYTNGHVAGVISSMVIKLGRTFERIFRNVQMSWPPPYPQNRLCVAILSSSETHR